MGAKKQAGGAGTRGGAPSKLGKKKNKGGEAGLKDGKVGAKGKVGQSGRQTTKREED